jgi:ABC-type bacteriocin/lantibiotic exporter with double-glycine peptidase domain
MSGRHQLWLCSLAVLVALLSAAPLELQRRIVNDAVEGANIRLLVMLSSIYLGVVLLQILLKYALRVYQGWLGESAIRYTRSHLCGIHAARHDTAPAEGRAVAIIGAEVEQLGGFVGDGVSEPLVNAGMLTVILGYMFAVEPLVAGISLIFFVPQLIGVPLLQRAINRRVEDRVALLRDMSDEVGGLDDKAATEAEGLIGRQIRAIFDNRMRIFLLKFASKGLVNLSNALAPLSVLAVGGYLVIQGGTSFGVIVAFISGFDRLADPARQLINFYRVMEQTKVRHAMIARWM